MALIGITADLNGAGNAGGHAKSGEAFFLPADYCRAIEQAGGTPVMLSPTSSRAVTSRISDHLDGLVLSGGNFDIHPAYYGETPTKEIGEIKAERTQFELRLTHLAIKRNLPLLGICGGAQAINVALGGTLYQDIATQLPEAMEHQQSRKKYTGGHRVQIRAGTRLGTIVKRQTLVVNTTHHQAIKSLGRGLIVNATAEDGVVEGIESPRHAFVVGVQWHPEALAPKFPQQRKIISAFVDACRTFSRRS